MKVFGQLEKAQIEQLSADPAGVELVTGRVWYNTTDSVYRGYDGSVVTEFADLATAQTFQNKTLDDALVSNHMEFTHLGATPAAPAAGFGRLYQKTDGNFYYINNTGGEVLFTSNLGIDDLTDVDTTTVAPSTGDMLRWDGSNWVTQLYVEMFAGSVAAGGFSSSTNTTVVYPTVTSDTLSAYNNGTGVYTVPANGAGTYVIAAAVPIQGTSVSNGLDSIRLLKNGSSVPGNMSARHPTGVSSAFTLSVCSVIKLASTDTIEVQVFTSRTGPSFTGGGTSYFSIIKVGEV